MFSSIINPGVSNPNGFELRSTALAIGCWKMIVNGSDKANINNPNNTPPSIINNGILLYRYLLLKNGTHRNRKTLYIAAPIFENTK